MSNITTYAELMTEKQRLKLLLNEREIQLKTEFEDFKVKLKPLGSILEFTEKITTKDRHNPLVNMGIDVGVNFLLKKVLFRNAGWMIKLVTPFVVKNFLSHEVGDKATWIDKAARFVKNKIS